jgi:glycosyltransferase involved in cell wall biosynthesis
VLVDPKDPAAIAAGIRQAIDRTDELAPLGLAQAARFTWSACAAAHEDAYLAAAGRA